MSMLRLLSFPRSATIVRVLWYVARNILPLSTMVSSVADASYLELSKRFDPDKQPVLFVAWVVCHRTGMIDMLLRSSGWLLINGPVKESHSMQTNPAERNTLD